MTMPIANFDVADPRRRQQNTHRIGGRTPASLCRLGGPSFAPRHEGEALEQMHVLLVLEQRASVE